MSNFQHRKKLCSKCSI